MMNEEYIPFWVFIIIMIFYMLMSIRRTMDSKLQIINKKLDTVLSSTNAAYPLMGDIAEKAVKAAKNGDRNKAINIVMKDTLCTKAQAEAMVKIIEQQ